MYLLNKERVGGKRNIEERRREKDRDGDGGKERKRSQERRSGGEREKQRGETDMEGGREREETGERETRGEKETERIFCLSSCFGLILSCEDEIFGAAASSFGLGKKVNRVKETAV